MNPALFLDRDGVLNEVVHRGSTVASPRHRDEFRILPGGRRLAETARAAGLLVVVVTNQPDLERGLLEETELRAMHDVLRREFRPDAIEVCGSGDDAHPRRKPNPGMLLDAAKKLDIDLSDSFLVGDSAKDVGAGRAAGVTTILLETGYNRAAHGSADYGFTSHDDIADFLLQQRTTA